MNARQLARLRQQLTERLGELDRILAPAFEREPLFPASIQISRHRCGRPNCRCATEGLLHESTRLRIRFKDGDATRCLKEDEVEKWRPRTDAYKRMRDAQRSFRSWSEEVSRLLDRVERARRSSAGLSPEDRERELR